MKARDQNPHLSHSFSGGLKQNKKKSETNFSGRLNLKAFKSCVWWDNLQSAVYQIAIIAKQITSHVFPLCGGSLINYNRNCHLCSC